FNHKLAIFFRVNSLAVLDERKMMKVMVAIDESEESLYPLKWTVDHLFLGLPPPVVAPPPLESDVGMVAVLIHVQQPFQHTVIPAGPAVYPTTYMTESVRKAQEQNTAELIVRALHICQDRVNPYGLLRDKMALLGSVSDYVAHRAKCSVLIVKPPKS
ncbi:hypothetical protein GIB67_034252, partial [Kingdonia uniflora]